MKRFIATMNDGSYINTPADNMEVKDDMIWAWNAGCLVALVDISAVVFAHVSERGEKDVLRSTV